MHLQGKLFKCPDSGLACFGGSHKHTAGKGHAVIIPAEKRRGLSDQYMMEPPADRQMPPDR